MVTARELITYMTNVAIADSEDIAAEFGITPQQADVAAWNAGLHWTQGSRDEPVVWQPRWGEDADENLEAYDGNLDVPLSLVDEPWARDGQVTPLDNIEPTGGVVAAPVMTVHVSELERTEAEAYLSSGYQPRLRTSIERIATYIVDAVRDLTVGDGKPRRVTCRDIHATMDTKGQKYEYNTVRKIANALGAVGRLDRAGGGKGGQWRYGVKV